MRKIFFTFFILAVLFFPKSEIFAQNTDLPCADGQPKSPTFSIETDLPSKCPADTVCTTRNGSLFRCWGPRAAGDGIQPGAEEETKPTPTPCTDETCTSAKGVRCGVNIGEMNQEGGTGIMTAIGCIPSEPKALIEGLLRYGTLAGGGIAFLLMLLGALQLITAEGNPESIKHGQERFYSAIIGLLIIIFSVLLMQIIGVDLLGFRELQPNTTTTIRPGGEN